MRYECTACRKQYDRFMRRPMGCFTPVDCKLVEISESEPERDLPKTAADVCAPEDVSALTMFGDAAENARRRLAREAASPRLSLGGRSYIVSDGAVFGRHGDIAPDELAADRSVSRRHAQLHLTADGWRLRNLAVSGSPLLVDGKRLAPEAECFLRSGRYRLRFGDSLDVELEIP